MSTQKGEPVASHSTKDTQQTNLGSAVPRRPRHSAIAYTIRRGDRENLLGMLRRARQIKESIDKDC